MKRNVQISVSLLSLLALLMISTGVSYSLVDQSTASTNQEGNEYSQTQDAVVCFLYPGFCSLETVLSLTAFDFPCQSRVHDSSTSVLVLLRNPH